jgi:hypothetical protein
VFLSPNYIGYRVSIVTNMFLYDPVLVWWYDVCVVLALSQVSLGKSGTFEQCRHVTQTGGAKRETFAERVERQGVTAKKVTLRGCLQGSPLGTCRPTGCFW